MSYFKTPYDTTVGKGFVTSKVIVSIQHLLVVNPPVETYLGTHDDSTGQPILGLITGVNESENHIPAFNHPIEVMSVDKKPYIFADVRPYVRPRNPNSTVNVADNSLPYVVKNQSEFNLTRARLAMAKVWTAGNRDSLLGISDIPGNVFAGWISQSIAHRFALDPLDQLKLAIISSFYYQSLFIDTDEFTSDDKEKLAGNIIRMQRAPAKIVFEVVDKITKLSNITDFCKAVQAILENPRLDDFNPGLLITIVKGSWFGTNAPELIATSLEYPPCWICLVYASLSERSYRNSVLSRISETYSKGKIDQMFIRSFVTLAQSATLYDRDETNF